MRTFLLAGTATFLALTATLRCDSAVAMERVLTGTQADAVSQVAQDLVARLRQIRKLRTTHKAPRESCDEVLTQELDSMPPALACAVGRSIVLEVESLWISDIAAQWLLQRGKWSDEIVRALAAQVDNPEAGWRRGFSLRALAHIRTDPNTRAVVVALLRKYVKDCDVFDLRRWACYEAGKYLDDDGVREMWTDVIVHDPDPLLVRWATMAVSVSADSPDEVREAVLGAIEKRFRGLVEASPREQDLIGGSLSRVLHKVVKNKEELVPTYLEVAVASDSRLLRADCCWALQEISRVVPEVVAKYKTQHEFWEKASAEEQQLAIDFWKNWWSTQDRAKRQ